MWNTQCLASHKEFVLIFCDGDSPVPWIFRIHWPREVHMKVLPPFFSHPEYRLWNIAMVVKSALRLVRKYRNDVFVPFGAVTAPDL